MPHLMELISTHEGSQEWICPICGRVILLETNPSRVEIVVDGDLSESHSGSTDGLSLISRTVNDG